MIGVIKEFARVKRIIKSVGANDEFNLISVEFANSMIDEAIRNIYLKRDYIGYVESGLVDIINMQEASIQILRDLQSQYTPYEKYQISDDLKDEPTLHERSDPTGK